MTVRFDLTDVRERALAEYMQTLDVKKYQSRNRFIIEAIAEYVDSQSITREQNEKDIRSIIREEMRVCFAEANYVPQPTTTAPILVDEEQKKSEQDILDDLICLQRVQIELDLDRFSGGSEPLGHHPGGYFVNTFEYYSVLEYRISEKFGLLVDEITHPPIEEV